MKQPTNQIITRRDALTRLAKLGLLTGALGPAALRGFAATKPDFKFLVVNDTHYASDACDGFFAGLVQQMNAERPAFVLHAGDVADNGEPHQLRRARDFFRALHGDFHPVMGNHDWTTATDRAAYLENFPRKLNYSFRHQGWQFIGLDSTEAQKYQNTTIQPETLKALDELLGRLSRDQPVVVFTHFPLCEGVKMRPVNADDLLAKFKGWDVRAIFNGHYHAFTECQRAGAPITTNRCCARRRDNHDGTKEKGYFVCEVTEGLLIRRFVAYRGV